MKVIDSDKLKTLGQRISAARERADLTTAQLARRLGVKTRTLTSWERDETSPRTNRLLTLSQMLGVAPTWLVEGTDRFAPEVPRATPMQIAEQLDHVRRSLESLSDQVEALSAMILDQQERDAA